MAGGSNASLESSPSRVCRDFLRNVCYRGKRCKYLHERSDDNHTDEYTFCHDFQNGACTWPGCKFLHCSESEEKHFRSTGELPPHVLAKLRANSEKSEFPICKDFLKGSCQRTNCKFRHFKEESQHNIMSSVHHNPPRVQHNFVGPGANENMRRFEDERR